MKISLRPSKPQDREFVNHLTRITMTSYVHQTWKTPAEWEEYFRINEFDLATTQIIMDNQKDIGRLTCSYRPAEIYIDNIHIVPEYQGRGIGRTIINSLINEAKEKGTTVSLCVLMVNPALNLYESMGFKTEVTKNHRYYMRHIPA